MVHNIKRKLQAFFIALGASLLFFSMPVAAAGGCNDDISFFPRWYDGLCEGGEIKSPRSFGGDTGRQFGVWIGIIALNILRMLMYVVSFASLGFVIWGGFKYMTQGDNSSGTAAARKTIQNAIIGLVISISAIAIVTFVSSRIQ